MLRRYLHIPIHQALIATGGFLFFFELGHPEIPFWADLVFTMGFMFLLNGMAASIDFLVALDAISKNEED